MPLALLKQGHSNRKILGLLFLEAAVIFAGITGSFWIEEWRQNREDLDVYHHLLEEIYYNAVIDESRIGFVKLRANDEWSINWGAPFPNIIDAPGWLWSSDQVTVEDVFPSGSAHLHGMNMPVRGGTYRVTFNSQTFEYAFEETGGS